MFLFPVVVGRSSLLCNYQRARNYPLPPVAVGCQFQMTNDQRWGHVPPPVAAGRSLQMSNDQRTQKYVNSTEVMGRAFQTTTNDQQTRKYLLPSVATDRSLQMSNDKRTRKYVSSIVAVGCLFQTRNNQRWGERASSRSHRSPTLGEQQPTDPEVRELHRSSGSRIPDNDPRQTNPEVPTPLRSHGLPISDEQPSTLGVHTSPRSRGSLTLDEQRPIDPEVPVRSRRSLTPDERQSTGPEVPAPAASKMLVDGLTMSQR